MPIATDPMLVQMYQIDVLGRRGVENTVVPPRYHGLFAARTSRVLSEAKRLCSQLWYDLLAKQEGSIWSWCIGHVNRQAAGTLAHNRPQCRRRPAQACQSHRSQAGARRAFRATVVPRARFRRTTRPHAPLHDRVIIALDRLAVPFEHRLLLPILLRAAPNTIVGIAPVLPA